MVSYRTGEKAFTICKIRLPYYPRHPFEMQPLCCAFFGNGRGPDRRRRKSPTAKAAAGLDLHSVGTATEGSTLVRDLTRPVASAAGAGLSPASGAKAPQAPKLNPRPPEPHANPLWGRVTTPSSIHAVFWASVS